MERWRKSFFRYRFVIRDPPHGCSMPDTDPSRSDRLDELFVAPAAAPVETPLVPSLPMVLPQEAEARHNPPPPVAKKKKQPFVRFDDLLKKLTPFIWVTATCLIVNVAYYIVMVSQGVDYLQPNVADLLKWGADYAPFTWGGQPWRLVTSMFMHCGLLHLGLNMWALWSAGRMLERLVGSIGFLIIYFASGIAGGLASMWWNGDVVSAGASGAIFGLLGAFATFIWNRADSFPLPALRQLRSSLAMCIGYNLLFGASIEGIDQAAHIGGLLTGLVLGWMLSQPLDYNTIERRWRKNLIAGAGAVLVLGILIVRHPPAPPDFLINELGIYDKVVPSTDEKFLDAARAYNAKELDSEQMIELVQKEILPPWQQVSEHFDALGNVPSGRKELVHQYRTELHLRVEAGSLLIEALQKKDSLKMSESKAKWKQADKIMKQRQQGR